MRGQGFTPKMLAVLGVGTAVAILVAAALAWFTEFKWRRALPTTGLPTASEPAPAAELPSLSTHVFEDLRARLDRAAHAQTQGWPLRSAAEAAAAAASAVPPIDPNHLDLVVLNGPNGLVAMVNGEKVTGKARLRDGSHVLSLAEGQLVLRTVDGVVHHVRLSAH